MKDGILKYGNLCAFIAVIVVNALAMMGVLGGVTTRDVSYMYKSLLTPADWAFSIWGLIYVLLAVLVIRQIKNTEVREKMDYWFMISCVLNIAWLFAWQYRGIAISFVLIFVLLLDLIMLMRATKGLDMLSNVAVGLYTGWINVAMLANLGALFTRYDWYLFSMRSSVSAVLGLALGLMWICLFIYSYSNAFYAIGSAWGYLAIALQTNFSGIKIMAIIGLIAFGASAIFVIMKKNVDTCCKY